MTKRTADEALCFGFDSNSCSSGAGNAGVVDCMVQSKEQLRLPAPTTMLNNKPSLHRTVTRLSSCSSTIDEDVDVIAISTQADQKECGRNAAKTDSSITRLTNARILQIDGTLLPGSLTIDSSSGIIVNISLGEQEVDSYSDIEDDIRIIEVIDCENNIISPGFIDIQLNGAYGVDFSNDGGGHTNAHDDSSNVQSKEEEDDGLTVNDILHVSHRLVETGVTSFCPTMISSSSETYRKILPLMNKARREQRQRQMQQDSLDQNSIGANILGMHLEGPFFAQSKRGAHDLQHITSPSQGMASVKEVYGINNEHENEVMGECHDDVSLEDIDIITLAPELDGALDAIQSLTGSNNRDETNSKNSTVVISCGHTEATYEDGIKAVSAGATLLTHLYNAMNPFHHRKPGLVGLLSSEAKLARMGTERPFFSMIVDGIHVHESAVCMAYQSHKYGCVLVTDAMSAMGLGDGEHTLGNMKVSIKGDRATLVGTDTLAGSVVSMDTCVKRFKQFTDCSTGEALMCATYHPAKVLKRHDIVGALQVGANADLVMLNDELDVLCAWVGGRLAFEKK